MEMVKAVWKGLVLFSTIMGRSSSLIFSSVRQRQTMPEHSLIMRAICCSVICSALKTRSPSFSRLLSSTIITPPPAWIELIALSILSW